MKYTGNTVNLISKMENEILSGKVNESEILNNLALVKGTLIKLNEVLEEGQDIFDEIIKGNKESDEYLKEKENGNTDN